MLFNSVEWVFVRVAVVYCCLVTGVLFIICLVGFYYVLLIMLLCLGSFGCVIMLLVCFVLFDLGWFVCWLVCCI